MWNCNQRGTILANRSNEEKSKIFICLLILCIYFTIQPKLIATRLIYIICQIFPCPILKALNKLCWVKNISEVMKYVMLTLENFTELNDIYIPFSIGAENFVS